MNLDAVTIQDCIEMRNFKCCAAIINDGKLSGFKTEKFPAEGTRANAGNSNTVKVYTSIIKMLEGKSNGK